MPCRNGRFTDNLIAFRSDEMAVPVNVGSGTAPETFTLARNAWYCLDAPQRSRPKLEIAEADGGGRSPLWFHSCRVCMIDRHGGGSPMQ